MKKKSIQQSSPSYHSKPKSDNKQKGDIVENLVSKMHDWPGVTVRTNVFLTPITGVGRKRQIDVLLTSDMAGYPVQIAIECKNEGEKIEAGAIEAFASKLKYLDIQRGVFVSTSPYTKGASESAKFHRIKTLMFTGLSSERLNEAVTDALQSCVYLLLHTGNITVPNSTNLTAQAHEIFTFFDTKGEYCGSIPDLIWFYWINGNLPNQLGHHSFEVKIPKGWKSLVGNNAVIHSKIIVEITIVGLVTSLRGSGTQHLLIDTENKFPEKGLFQMKFDTKNLTLPIQTANNEEQLKEILNEPAIFKLNIGRIPLPRIIFNSMYWPPSDRVLKVIEKQATAFKNKEIDTPVPFDFTEMEGLDLKTVFEPIKKDYPFLRRIKIVQHQKKPYHIF